VFEVANQKSKRQEEAEVRDGREKEGWTHHKSRD